MFTVCRQEFLFGFGVFEIAFVRIGGVLINSSSTYCCFELCSANIGKNGVKFITVTAFCYFCTKSNL